MDIISKYREKISKYKVETLLWRNLRKTESSAIIEIWLKSYRSSYEAYYMSSSYYFKAFRPIIMKILERDETVLGILRDEDMGEIDVSGFSVYEGDVLHYIYLKHMNRRMGLSKLLIPEGIERVSFLNRSFKENFLSKKYKYEPFTRYV